MSDIQRTSFRPPALYALILLAAYLAYLVLAPFLTTLTWATIFAILFHGMHVTLSRRIGPNRAALVTTLVVALVIVAPAAALIASVSREVPDLADYLRQASRGAPDRIRRLWEIARVRSPVALPEEPMDLLIEGGRRTLMVVAPRAGAFVANVFATLGNLLAMLFALFFMLRDGDAMSRELRDRLPLSARDSERLLRETRDLVIASVGAGLVVAVAQGLAGGVTFWLVGIAAPAFWGVVVAFASLLPVVGAALVWIPAGVGLLLSGEIGRGVVMLLVGAFGISMIDNILRPLLLSGRTSMSALTVFFGLIGGAAAFGFIGLVIGPIVLVITARLLTTLQRPDLEDESATTDRIVAAGD